MRGHPSYASLLRAGGFNVLNLANNHIMDHGWDAVARQHSPAHLIWRRLHSLRPRHLRGVVQILGREWEQLRGVK